MDLKKILEERLAFHNEKKNEYDKNATFYRDNALVALGKSLAIEELLNSDLMEQENIKE